MSRFFEELAAFLGPEGFQCTDQTKAVYGTDWTKIPGHPVGIVFPKSTEQVAHVLKTCSKYQTPVIPSGGRTGLSGGAVASRGDELILSLDKMNRVGTVDCVGRSVQVEAGAITQSVQDAARNSGLFFALDLAAKGSCQIGGNLSTNAGGLKYIRYGGMREQVLGIEVVLPDGRVLDLNRELYKNNSGYDLKHLFIGAEGTLGVITKATLKLHPLPKDPLLCLLAVDNFDRTLEILQRFNSSGFAVSAFEFFSDRAMDFVIQHGLRQPLQSRSPYYGLVEVERSSPGLVSEWETLVAGLFEDEIAVDGAMATSSEEFARLWAYRELITESLAASGQVRKNDVSLPVRKLGEFVTAVEAMEIPTGIDLVLFGHMGDGNIHLNYRSDKDYTDFRSVTNKIEQQVFSHLLALGGSPSAEHGIGLVKRSVFPDFVSETERSVMRQVKALLDPAGIMNPGKIFE